MTLRKPLRRYRLARAGRASHRAGVCHGITAGRHTGSTRGVEGYFDGVSRTGLKRKLEWGVNAVELTIMSDFHGHGRLRAKGNVDVDPAKALCIQKGAGLKCAVPWADIVNFTKCRARD